MGRRGAADQRFENIYALPRLHALFAKHGVRPTYVITHPVATDSARRKSCGRCRRRRLRDRRAPPRVGNAALHRGDIRRHPYASTLPRAQFAAQLSRSPTRSNAPWAGVPCPIAPAGLASPPITSRRSSAVAISWIRASCRFLRNPQGWARIRRGAAAPLLPGLRQRDAARLERVLEVPVSTALNRRLPRTLQYAYARAPKPYMTKRVLRALRLLRMRWLRPSYSSLDDMIGLARDLARWNEPVLNLFFHSSEAILGGSPYNRTQGELDAFFDRLDRFLSYATRELRATPATFAEFRAAYARSPR